MANAFVKKASFKCERGTWYSVTSEYLISILFDALLAQEILVPFPLIFAYKTYLYVYITCICNCIVLINTFYLCIIRPSIRVAVRI